MNTGFDPTDPFRTITPPPEVSRVEGCNCGGLEMHRWLDCSIWSLPYFEQTANIAAAKDRLKQFSADLNKDLHAWLAAIPQTAVPAPETESSREPISPRSA